MQIVSAHMRKNNFFLRRLKIVFAILLGLYWFFLRPVGANRTVTGIISKGHMSGHIHAGMAGLQHKTSLINRHLATNHHTAIISKGPLSAQLYAGMVGLQHKIGLKIRQNAASHHTVAIVVSGTMKKNGKI